MQQAIEAIVSKVSEHETTINRLERKMYRDLKKDGGQADEPIIQITDPPPADPFANMAAGDQLPPEMNV